MGLETALPDKGPTQRRGDCQGLRVLRLRRVCQGTKARKAGNVGLQPALRLVVLGSRSCQIVFRWNPTISLKNMRPVTGRTPSTG